MRSRWFLHALAAAGLALPLAAAAAPAAAPDAADPADPAAADAPARPMPRWLLQSARDGRPLMPEDLRGRFQLVSFGYISCPDVCPSTLAQMQQVLAALGERAQGLQPLFVSVDPERDTLPVLRAYTGSFDPRILGLTGPQALVERAAAAFNVRYAKVVSPGAAPDSYTVDHTVGMWLVGPDGQLLNRYAHGMPTEAVVARIVRWMDAAEQTAAK